jgi:hypothetical protein
LTKVPAVSVKGAIGSSTSAFGKASLNAVSATTRPEPASAAVRSRGIGSVEHRFDVQQQQGLHRLRQHLRRRSAHRWRPAARRRAARPRVGGSPR